MIRRQNIAGYVLLCFCTIALLLPLVFFVSVRFIQSSQQRELRKYNSNDKHLTKIILTETEFTASVIKDNDELFYNGLMYDIRSVTKINGKYTIEALADSKETKCNEINRHLHGKQQDKTGYKGFVYMFQYYEKSKVMTFGFSNGCLLHHPFDQLHFISYCTEIPSPPPDYLPAV